MLLCIEVGKFIKDVWGEIICLIDMFCVVVEEFVWVGGELMNFEILLWVKGYWGMYKFVLIGFCLFIFFFNFLLNLVVYKIVLVIVVGCLFVFKFVSWILIGVILIGEILVEMNFFKGVFLILFSCWDGVDLLMMDEWLKLLSFIGLLVVGWDLKVWVGKKKVVFEFGGNVVCIVELDVNFEDVVNCIVFGVFY